MTNRLSRSVEQDAQEIIDTYKALRDTQSSYEELARKYWKLKKKYTKLHKATKLKSTKKKK